MDETKHPLAAPQPQYQPAATPQEFHGDGTPKGQAPAPERYVRGPDMVPQPSTRTPVSDLIRKP